MFSDFDEKEKSNPLNTKNTNDEESLTEDGILLNYKKTKIGNKTVEEYTIIEENPNMEKEIKDGEDRLKEILEKAPSQNELDDPNSEFNLEFYNNLEKDSQLFDETEFDDSVVQEAEENYLEFENVPQDEPQLEM